MGRKTNPVGLRLCLNQTWESSWSSTYKYSNLLHKDFQIRRYTLYALSTKNLIMGECRISRHSLTKQIILYITAYAFKKKPASQLDKIYKQWVEGGQFNSKLKLGVSRIVACEPKQVTINVVLLKSLGHLHPLHLARYLALLLEKHMPLNLLKKQMNRLTIYWRDAGGIRIEICGKFDGIDMARKESVQEGQVPLQTLKARINYGTAQAYTVYGVFGIKVWTYHHNMNK